MVGYGFGNDIPPQAETESTLGYKQGAVLWESYICVLRPNMNIPTKGVPYPCKTESQIIFKFTNNRIRGGEMPMRVDIPTITRIQNVHLVNILRSKMFI